MTKRTERAVAQHHIARFDRAMQAAQLTHLMDVERHQRHLHDHAGCQIHQRQQLDDDTAEALSLAENFVREPMHPLDEAVAFAELAMQEGKDAKGIAAEFGVPDQYVRQRMKLATLADPIKAAYRDGGIDTGTAEAFASVPPERQLGVWQEVGGTPQHAHHVRNVIANAWIDARVAMFDITKLPEGSVSSDLFSDRVLIERKAFMEAQGEALLAERTALTEAGWSEVVTGPQADGGSCSAFEQLRLV